jgi:hypothetical protein
MTPADDLAQMRGYACSWCQIILAVGDLAQFARWELV